MTSNYYTPMILERFTSRQLRRQHKRAHTRKLADFPRHNVLPLDGPAHDISTVGGRINAENLAIFDDKAANAVLLDAESQLKSGYPTIAASSLVARRNRIVQLPEEMFDTQPDMKFFSDLVKPIQYRWKFQNQNPKVKTLTPSKHGFHPRSQSPTFQRLIEATERLQVLSEDETGIYVERHDDLDFETQSQIILDVTSKPKISRSVKSEPNSTRALSLSPSKESSNILSELKPEIKSLEQSQKEETTFYEEDEEEIDYLTANPTPRLKPQQEFKVDFKRTDSHSELHLFLPHILDAYSRGDTPENAYVKNQNNKLTLPSIGDMSEVKTQEDEKAKHKRNQKSETKKKKKKHIRVKSGNDDKEIPDRLNDVPTLISLEKEKDVHHPASMCVFENCQYHMHKKSTKLRQP